MRYILLLCFLCLFTQTSAQYTVLYENSFRNWAPGQGWVMLDNDTIPKSAGLVTHGFFGGVPVPFYLEIYEYMLGVDQSLSLTDKVMITPPIVVGNNSFYRYFSNFNTGTELSSWVIPNHNDTTLSGLTDSLGNSNQNGFNIYSLSAYAGDTIRLAFRIRGLVTKSFIDNLLVLDKYSLAWVPDSCFRNYLKNTIPTAFAGDSLNFLDSSVIFRTSIVNPNSCMTSLEGLQYFVNLRYLNVPNNQISYIPPNKINYLDSANAENNFLPLFPDAPYCVRLRATNNLIKNIPNLRNDQLELLHMQNNLIYDCLTCSNRFVDGNLSGNIFTAKECFYYTLVLTPNPASLPAPNCSQNLGSIKGKAFYDINQNGSYDLTDILLVNQKINYFQGTDITTFLDGTYGIVVDSGLVNMSLTDLPPYFVCNTPLSDTIDVQEVINHDFIVTATSNVTNLKISLNSTGTTRLKESLTLSLNVKNIGTQVAAGTVKMYLPPGYTLLAIQNGSILNDTLTWNVNLNPFAHTDNMITIQVDSFPINQETFFTANLSVLNDIDTSNNSSTIGVMIRDSLVIFNPPTGFPYDPNNKLVDKPIVAPGFQDYLTYNINFENIGNANASRVMVRDYLSGKLDINSFELLSTSHPCIVSYGADSMLQFLFEPIALTPTSVDSLNSKGHIWFRIKPKNPINLNDTIYNSAGIYFDTQPAIITNQSMVWVADTAVHGARFTSDITTVCMNTLRNVQFRNQSGDMPLSLEWQFPGGTPSVSSDPIPLVNYAAAGDYDVTLIANYLGYSDTLIKPAYIHVVPVVSPTIISSGNDSICIGDSVQLSTSYPGTNYLWSNGLTTSTIYVSTAANYYATITDNNGCRVSSFSIPIRVVPNPTPVITGDDTICNGSSASLTAGTYSSYLWSTGDTSEVIQSQLPGWNSVIVTSTIGCEGSDSLFLNVLNNTLVTIAGPDFICNGDHAVLDAGQGYVNYLWSTNESSSTISGSTAGPYTVTVTDTIGCITSDTFLLSVITLNPLAANFDSICQGNQMVLDAGIGFVSYYWNTTDTTQQINVSTTGNYSVTVVDTNGCSGTDSIYFTLLSLPNPVISGPDSICQGTDAILDAGSGFMNYQWSTQDSTEQITVSNGGIYNVTVIGTNGCINSAVHQLNVISVDTSVVVSGATLTSQANLATSWQWMYCDSSIISTATGNSYLATQGGSFAVIITENGCVDTSACYSISLAGIDLLQDNKISLYPNPVDKILYLNGLNGIEINSVKIYSSTGQLIRLIDNATNFMKIDLSNIVSGMYFIELNSNIDSLRYRIIVRHD